MLVQKPNEKIVCLNFSNNEFIKPTGNKFDVESPWFGSVVGESFESTAQDLNHIVQNAEKAFTGWSKTPIKERSQYLFKLRDILMRDLDKISQIISLENGKLPFESKAGLLKGIEVLEFALSIQNLDHGGKIEVSRGVFCEYRREALGVVASITPFNFPAMVPMWTIPISIVLGNCLIWKPSEKTPLTSNYIAKAFVEAGFPAGVLNILQGSRTAVEAILDHPKIQAVSFVGSTKIAKLVYEKGSLHGKRVLALGGAKNHIFLMPDADIEICGKGISDSFTGCAGQRCMAASVLLAVGAVDKQIEKIVEQTKSLQVGHDMGAIITKEQVAFLHKAIEQAEKDGAKILLDGRKAQAPKNYSNGFWIGPTVIDHVKPGTQAAQVELFGPIISIVRCENLSQALEIENSNPYGNAASVFTQNGPVAEFVATHAKAGMVGINVGVPVPREPFSFGGINESKYGFGDITGINSLNFWSSIKKITTKWQIQQDANWMS